MNWTMYEKIERQIASLRAHRLDKDNFPRMDSERIATPVTCENAADTLQALLDVARAAKAFDDGAGTYDEYKRIQDALDKLDGVIDGEQYQVEVRELRAALEQIDGNELIAIEARFYAWNNASDQQIDDVTYLLNTLKGVLSAVTNATP